MKLTDIYNIIKEEMSDEDIVAILKKQLDPKSTVKVNKPVVKPNIIYTDKVNEGPIERREYKGLSYIVRYDAPKGYIAIGKGEIENEIAPQYFDKLDDADEHAELEIDGYLSSDINEEFKRMQELAGVVNENSNPNRMLELIQMYVDNYSDEGMSAEAAIRKIDELLQGKLDGYDIAFMAGEEDNY